LCGETLPWDLEKSPDKIDEGRSERIEKVAEYRRRNPRAPGAVVIIVETRREQCEEEGEDERAGQGGERGGGGETGCGPVLVPNKN